MVLPDGGFEVRYGKTNGPGIIGISYYFDATGRFKESVRWGCDGY
jgi:hypothetical protein